MRVSEHHQSNKLGWNFGLRLFPASSIFVKSLHRISISSLNIWLALQVKPRILAFARYTVMWAVYFVFQIRSLVSCLKEFACFTELTKFWLKWFRMSLHCSLMLQYPPWYPLSISSTSHHLCFCFLSSSTWQQAFPSLLILPKFQLWFPNTGFLWCILLLSFFLSFSLLCG